MPSWVALLGHLRDDVLLVPRPRLKHASRNQGQMLCILVLDDEPLISMMLEEWLRELGFEPVGPVETTATALAILANSVPDGATLDMSLRDEDCYPVAEALRSRGVPFAFATGYEADVLPGRFKNEVILSKPFTFEGLRGVLAVLFAAGARV
jgi:CheY-like chemotaxis protein